MKKYLFLFAALLAFPALAGNMTIRNQSKAAISVHVDSEGGNHLNFPVGRFQSTTVWIPEDRTSAVISIWSYVSDAIYTPFVYYYTSLDSLVTVGPPFANPANITFTIQYLPYNYPLLEAMPLVEAE
jgi:hypothetical protein